MKESLGKKLKLLIGVLSLCSVWLCSCYEPIEGCLDSTAANFEFSADNACDSCCVFPKVSLSFSLYHDTVRYSIDSVYKDEQGLDYRILEFSFLISEVAFFQESTNTQVSVSDSISYRCETNDIITSNSFFELTNNAQTLTLSNFKNYIGLSNLSFNIGVVSCLSELNEDNIDDQFTSFQNIIDLKDESGIFQSQTLTLLDVMSQDTLQFSNYDLLTNTSDQILEVAIGENINIPIKVQFNQWLKGLDLSTMSTTDVSNLMAENTSRIFVFE